MTIKYPIWINKIEGAAQTPEEMNGLVEVLQNHAENLSLHDVRILAASSGIYTDALTPTSEVPTEVGDKVFLVTQPGTYTNFGNVVLPENNFGFIFKNGSSFTIQSVEMPDVAKTSDVNGTSETLVLTQKGANILANNRVSKSELGFTETIANTEFITELIGSDLNNSELWGEGFFNAIGGINTGTEWRYSLKYYPIQSGMFALKLSMYGNACIIFYDENKTFLSSHKTTNTNPNNYYEANIQFPTKAKFIRISHYNTLSTDNISIKNINSVFEITDEVFVMKEKFDNDVNLLIDNKVESAEFQSGITEIIKDVTGLDIIPINTNFIEELTGSLLTNTELWEEGAVWRTDGSERATADFYRTKKRYKLRTGTYNVNFQLQGNNYGYALYREDGTFLKGGTNATSDFQLIVDEDCYIRFSHRKDRNTNLIKILNTEVIKTTIITNENIEEYMPSSGKQAIRQVYLDTYRAKKRRPLVTIISDDGQPHNLEWFVPILDEFGVKATFAMVGSRIKSKDDGISNISISSEQTRELYLQGHDIASHTWTHTQNWITVLTLEQIEEEMSRNKVFLETLTMTSVNMFISPFGLRSTPIDNIISKYYDVNFISGIGDYIRLPLDNYIMTRTSFDSNETTPSLLWESSLKPKIDDAITNNRWIVFAIHPQYNQYNTWENKESRKAELRTLLQYCKDNDVEVVTAKKGYEYYKNHVDIGVKRVDAKYYKLAMDMTEENVNYF